MNHESNNNKKQESKAKQNSYNLGDIILSKMNFVLEKGILNNTNSF